jgi:hypothetical protein
VLTFVCIAFPQHTAAASFSLNLLSSLSLLFLLHWIVRRRGLYKTKGIENIAHLVFSVPYTSRRSHPHKAEAAAAISTIKMNRRKGTQQPSTRNTYKKSTKKGGRINNQTKIKDCTSGAHSPPHLHENRRCSRESHASFFFAFFWRILKTQRRADTHTHTKDSTTYTIKVGITITIEKKDSGHIYMCV